MVVTTAVGVGVGAVGAGVGAEVDSSHRNPAAKVAVEVQRQGCRLLLTALSSALDGRVTSRPRYLQMISLTSRKLYVSLSTPMNIKNSFPARLALVLLGALYMYTNAIECRAGWTSPPVS